MEYILQTVSCSLNASINIPTPYRSGSVAGKLEVMNDVPLFEELNAMNTKLAVMKSFPENRAFARFRSGRRSVRVFPLPQLPHYP